MTKIVDTVFGGTDDSAQKYQKQANEDNKQFIAQQTAQARDDIMGLFPKADDARNAGFQSALDVIGASTPEMLLAQQQGVQGASGALLSGLPQIQNAILGNEIDYSALQAPQAINVDTSWLSQQLPTVEPDKNSNGSYLGGAHSNLLGGINTNEDLFRAAANGRIPGISSKDQDFWARHLKNAAGQAGLQHTSWVKNPNQAYGNVVGAEGGFSPDNEQRAANLLTSYAQMANLPMGGQTQNTNYSPISGTMPRMGGTLPMNRRR